MGCTKPYLMPCPKNPCGISLTPCGPGCAYFFYESGTDTSFVQTMPRTIDQFTTDELLAEIRRRMVVV